MLWDGLAYIATNTEAIESCQNEDSIIIRRCTKAKTKDCSNQDCKIKGILTS